MNLFASNLRRLRKDKNLTQLEVAQACGVSKALVGNYETGARQTPPWEFVVKAAKLFEVPTSKLTGYPTFEELQEFMKVSETKTVYGDPFTQHDIRRKYRVGTESDKRRIENAMYAIFEGDKKTITEILEWLQQ